MARYNDKDKKYKSIQEDIKKKAKQQSLKLVSRLDPIGEANRIRKSFNLDLLNSIGEQIGISVKYPPNVFPAAGVLLDSYPAELAAFMIAFGFTEGVRAVIMMFLEDIERMEKARAQFVGRMKESRIDQAAKIIANMLCLMDSCSFARETFHGMVIPSMKEQVKSNLSKIDPELADIITK